jgi:hypothetical protein
MKKHLTAWVRRAGSKETYTKVAFPDCLKVSDVYAEVERLGLEFDSTAIHWE